MSGKIQLSFVKKELGEPQATAYLTKLVNEAAKLCKSDFDNITLALCAQTILKEYWMLKTDEIILALRNGCLGRYGKTYGAINFQTVFEWIQKYWDERNGTTEAQHETNKNSWGNNADRINNEQSFKDILGGLNE